MNITITQNQESAAATLNRMWGEVLPQVQPRADRCGFGAAWAKMCSERTQKAADAAAVAARNAFCADAAIAARAAASAAFFAADADAHAVDADAAVVACAASGWSCACAAAARAVAAVAYAVAAVAAYEDAARARAAAWAASAGDPFGG